MRLLRLSKRQRDRLKVICHSDPDGGKVRRAEALLWLDDGETATSVAKRLGVGRRTLYRWMSDFTSKGRRSIEARLSPRPRPGRPSVKGRLVANIARRVMKHPPDRYGYAHCSWTVRLIQQHIRTTTGAEVALATVRNALRSIGLSNKRPRYTLSRESPTWRQAKGGSNAVFSAESAPFCSSSTRVGSTKSRPCAELGRQSGVRSKSPSSVLIVVWDSPASSTS